MFVSALLILSASIVILASAWGYPDPDVRQTTEMIRMIVSAL